MKEGRSKSQGNDPPPTLRLLCSLTGMLDFAVFLVIGFDINNEDFPFEAQQQAMR